MRTSKDFDNIYFPNEKQKQVAIIIWNIVENSGLTQREFANSIGISLATLTNIYRPNNQKLPTPNVVRLISLRSDNPPFVYKQLMNLLDYNILKYPFHKGVNIKQRPQKNPKSAIAFQVYKIYSHLGTNNFCTIVCAYTEQDAMQQVLQKDLVIDRVEHICSPGIIEHKQLFERTY